MLVAFFARSLFLQGALLRDDAVTPSYAQACDSLLDVSAETRGPKSRICGQVAPDFRDSAAKPTRFAPTPKPYARPYPGWLIWAAITHRSSNITVTPMKAVIAL